MKPDELGRLTHGEFLEMWEAHQDYMHEVYKLEMWQFAQLASWVTGPHVKKTVDPKKFFDPSKVEEKESKPKQSPENKREALADLKGQFDRLEKGG